MGKIGKVSQTKPLRVKGEKDTTPKIKKGERARAEMNIHVL